MNKIGLHAMTCVTDWSNDSIKRAIACAAEWGFDLIETVVLDPKNARADETAKELERYKLPCVTGTALSPDADISSSESDVRRKGEQYLRESLYAARDMGSSMLTGVTHSAMYRYPKAPEPGCRQRVTESLEKLASVAKETEVVLGVEAVNRYESNVINRVADAADLVRSIGSPWLAVHIDTYHMNIEEHDAETAISDAVSLIGHVHVGESHRGYLGTGSIDFPRFFRALLRAGYEKQIVFEAFSRGILNEKSANNLAAWRADWSSSEQIARHALAFVKSGLETAEIELAGPEQS